MFFKRLALRLYIKHYKNNQSVRSFFELLSLDILVKAGMVVLIPIYTQIMSRQDFGTFNYLFFYISTTSLIVNFGLYVPHTKLINQNDISLHNSINGTIFLLFFIPNLLIASFILIFHLDEWIAKLLFYNSKIDFFKYRYIMQIAVFAAAFNFMLNSWLLAKKKIKLLQNLQVLRFLVHIPVILGLYFRIYEDAVNFRLWSFYGLDLLISTIIFFSLQNEIQWKFQKKLIKPIFVIAFPIFLNACLAIFLNFIDKLYLENSNYQSQMPSYSLATQLASIIPIISLSFFNVMLPDFLKNTDLEQNFGHTQRTEKRLLALLGATGICIWIASLFSLWLGVFPKSYSDITWILIALVIARIMEALAQLYVRFTILLEKTWISLIYSVLASPIVMVLNNQLIPVYGMNACVGVILLNSLMTYFFFKIVVSWQINQ